MDIQVKVNVLVNSENKTKAMASIIFDNVFMVTGIKVIEGQNGVFVSMPQRKNASGEYKDICFPKTADFRKEITEKIIEEYNKEVVQKQNNVSESYASNYSFSSDDLPF